MKPNAGENSKPKEKKYCITFELICPFESELDVSPSQESRGMGRDSFTGRNEQNRAKQDWDEPSRSPARVDRQQRGERARRQPDVMSDSGSDCPSDADPGQQMGKPRGSRRSMSTPRDNKGQYPMDRNYSDVDDVDDTYNDYSSQRNYKQGRIPNGQARDVNNTGRSPANRNDIIQSPPNQNRDRVCDERKPPPMRNQDARTRGGTNQQLGNAQYDEYDDQFNQNANVRNPRPGTAPASGKKKTYLCECTLAPEDGVDMEDYEGDEGRRDPNVAPNRGMIGNNRARIPNKDDRYNQTRPGSNRGGRNSNQGYQYEDDRYNQTSPGSNRGGRNSNQGYQYEDDYQMNEEDDSCDEDMQRMCEELHTLCGNIDKGQKSNEQSGYRPYSDRRTSRDRGELKEERRGGPGRRLNSGPPKQKTSFKCHCEMENLGF